jgi:hypothetical protein
MISQPGRDEAASALADIGRQQEKVITAVLVPAWYWAVVAVGMVAIGAAADSRARLVLALVIPAAVIVIAALTVAMIIGAYRRVQVRGQDLLGDRGALAIVGFVFAVDGVSLGVAFGWRAAGLPLPGTIGTAVGGAALLAGGPLLMNRLRRVMLSNRAGSFR